MGQGAVFQHLLHLLVMIVQKSHRYIVGDIFAKVAFLKAIRGIDPFLFYQVLVNFMEPRSCGLYLWLDLIALCTAALQLAGGLVPLFKGEVVFKADFLGPAVNGDPDIQKGMLGNVLLFSYKKGNGEC